MKLPPYINGLFLKYQLTINNINTSLAKLIKGSTIINILCPSCSHNYALVSYKLFSCIKPLDKINNDPQKIQ